MIVGVSRAGVPPGTPGTGRTGANVAGTYLGCRRVRIEVATSEVMGLARSNWQRPDA